MTITTAICNSFKVEALQAGHCFNITQSGVSATGSNAAFTLTSITSTAGISVGMAVTGTNVAAGAVVASSNSATQVTLSKAHTGSVTTVTFTADVFKIALIKSGASSSFSGTQTNIGTPGSSASSTSNLGTDEASGAGYTSNGFTLTNISPALSSTTATTSFSVNPNWTSATISTIGGIIYNSSTRQGAAATPLGGRTVSVHDFGGTQSVASGTLTLVMPTNDSSNAIIRLA